MALNAHGRDFWVGQVWRSKDTRDWERHVIIQDLRPLVAVCHTLLFPLSDRKMLKRSTRINLKQLTKRWTLCEGKGKCALCQRDRPAPATTAKGEWR